jgi:predicted nucleic acid-binding Zn ribbon protein
MSSAKRPPGRKSQLTPLSESLGLSLSRGFLNFTAQKLRVFEIWPRVVGPEAAARTRPEVLQDGCLTVLVPGPAWLDRYTYEKSAWLARLNRELADQALVEDIKFRIGEF